MRVDATAAHQQASTKSILAKGVHPLTVPVRVVEGPAEGIALGFRQEMLSVGEGSVCTGGGLGSDFIMLKWGERELLLRGSELLRAWVKTFSPEDAARFPDDVKEVAPR